MDDFKGRVIQFHQYCDAMRVEAAFELAAQLERTAVTGADHVMLGICQSRIGWFAQAEHTLSGVLPSLAPGEALTRRVSAELATVKNQLGKIEESAEIEKQLYSRRCYTIADPARAAFIPLFRERLLEDGDTVEGKRVFMVLAGGQGDAIEQFRNIDNLLAEGASQICVNTPESLRELVSNAALAVTHQTGTFDELAQCDCLMLGNIMNLRYRSPDAPKVSRVGYMRPAQIRKNPVRLEPLPGKIKIGIVWRSTNATWFQCRHEPFRSIPLPVLEPLLAQAQIQFFSLQFGALTQAEQAILARHHVVDAAPAVRSFADLADIVMQLDLVITIDSAPAHLCGALDVPVWNLLAQVSDWRWGDAAQRTTALYPSMRLLRQRVLGDWQPVVAELCAQLARIEVLAHPARRS
ncbi:glycosyltransferase family 9 protein [Burkholderia sp. Ax-1719]|uniref:glycosyltransferase family 9 protein n=1 Tax=Burkholderia sp. Ax-1719 TaxID=2608334 RepID=UPI001423B2E9|nr:glycosyltransferase family 9 protein [Burkholderia sp. Ax-1719]NIE62411.1 glycosyltransferase family 9 protein [Burkholderia sp. Ax-1719]